MLHIFCGNFWSGLMLDASFIENYEGGLGGGGDFCFTFSKSTPEAVIKRGRFGVRQNRQNRWEAAKTTDVFFFL